MKINNTDELDLAIIELEKRKVVQQSILLSQFHTTYEGLKPINLIKNAFHKITEPGDTRGTILKAVGGIGAGFLAKNLLIGKSTSVVGSLISNAVKVTATNVVLKNAEKIKAYGTAIVHNLFKSTQKKLS
ncbi:MAG: hypothetical protein JWQ27_1678 [Ferruginibacter sp.]|nr:hypothetical protein [Ferruginibacter sp.]